MISQFGPTLGIVNVLLLLTVGSAQGQTNRSVYTGLEPKQCRTLRSSSAGAGDYEARCRGVAGYTLLVSEGDLRQNVTVVTPRRGKHSLELWTVISGGFSSVGPKAEWRMRTEKGQLKPFALIIRYNASEDPEHSERITSYLAVAKITAAEICVTAKIKSGPKANVDARQAADEAATKPCLKAK